MIRFKRIPFATRAEMRGIWDRTTRVNGCLLLAPESPKKNPNNVIIRGENHTTTRVVWAETFGDKDLDTHEVNHIASCPNTGDTHPLCIEPSHLHLCATHAGALAAAKQRGRNVFRQKCVHGDSSRSPAGNCRICHKVAKQKYNAKKAAQVTA